MRERLIACLSVIVVCQFVTPVFAQNDVIKSDEELLKANKIGTDGPALVSHLKDRSLTENQLAKLQDLIKQLGARAFTEREKAQQALIKHGPAVRPLLREALKQTDPEVRKRAEQCLESIEAVHSPAVTSAVVRLLAYRKPAEAVETLLLFAPYTDSEAIDDDVLQALIAVTDFAKLTNDSPLMKARQNKVTVRRAAAAHVLSRSPDEKQRKLAHELLKDKEVLVRYRAATGLLERNDKTAVLALIALLKDAPDPLVWQVEDWLVRLAGEPQSKVVSPHSTPETRQEWAADYEKWWKEKGDKIDVAKALQQSPYLGLTLVPEMHANQLSEVDRTGKVLFKVTLNQPRCIQSLSGGRYLVGEANGNLVSERDRKGTILWKHDFNDPSFCERLNNGNTVMGNGKGIIEVTQAGKEVMNYKPDDSFYIHGMCRKSNGNLVLISMNGTLRELTPVGKEIFSVALDKFGKNGNNWCHVQGLARDRYLLSDIEKGLVIEVDKEGKEQWRYELKDACCAQRLANGNTVIQSFSEQKIIEVDRDKKIVWEYKTSSQGWRFQRR